MLFLAQWAVGVAVAEPSTGEPWRWAGSLGRILDKAEVLLSLAFVEICLCYNDKASKEQLKRPGDVREAETIHQPFFNSISALDFVTKTSPNCIEPLHQFRKIVGPLYRESRMVK